MNRRIFTIVKATIMEICNRK